MTKKHFNEIAKIISNTKKGNLTIEQFEYDLACYFITLNKNFDIQKFINLCKK